MVTGDHGEMLGYHFCWGKQTVYDQCFHVPLIIRDPHRREAAGTVVEDLTESVDIAPTILDWVGQEIPPAFDGRSLLPFVEGLVPAHWRDHVFCELDFGDPVEATRYQRRLGLSLAEANFAVLRERRYKYVHFNGGLPPLLFDLENDPGELTDVASDPALASELLRLARRMLDHRIAHAAHATSGMKLTEAGVRQAEPR